MKKVNGGYAFKAVVSGKQAGIKERIKTIKSGDSIHIEATFGVDTHHNPTKPAIFRQGEFLPLEKALKEGVVNWESFVKSNKPTYAPLAYMLMVCDFSGTYDTATGQWSDESVINFYSPRGVGKVGDTPVVVCSQVREKQGVDTIVVLSAVMNAFREKALSFMSNCLGGRYDFLQKRFKALKVEVK